MKIKRYFQGVWKQAKMVRWPTRKDLTKSVCIVLMVVAVSAIAISLSDLLIIKILQLLDKQFPTIDPEVPEDIRMFINMLF